MAQNRRRCNFGRVLEGMATPNTFLKRSQHGGSFLTANVSSEKQSKNPKNAVKVFGAKNCQKRPPKMGGKASNAKEGGKRQEIPLTIGGSVQKSLDRYWQRFWSNI